MDEKKSFWEIPWPMYFIYPVKKLYRKITKDKKPKLPKQKTKMIISSTIIVLSLIVIWMLQGFGNPIHMFIDDMFFLEPSDIMSAADQGAMYGLYMIATAFIVMIIMKLLIFFVYGEEDHPFWTVDGISLILLSVALSLLVDTILKNSSFEQWVSPLLRGPASGNTPFDIDTSFFVPGILFGILLFFVINDVATSVLSINITILLINNIPSLGSFGTSVLSCIVLAAAVNIVVSLLDKLGVVDAVCGFIIKWVYTLKYYLMVLFFPVLIIYIISKIKKRS